MTDPSPTPTPESDRSTVTVGRCFFGATISGSLAFAMYWLTSAIAHTFASKPPQMSSEFALRLSLAVRTLVVGVATLATALFAFATLGLIALGIQTFLRQVTQPKTDASEQN